MGESPTCTRVTSLRMRVIYYYHDLSQHRTAWFVPYHSFVSVQNQNKRTMDTWEEIFIELINQNLSKRLKIAREIINIWTVWR